ncbi:hypothetical protein K7G82_23485 [Sphingomonas colocasiae]|uniref:DUF4440 domain-containing protein n=2 Tax=Sphingomonas colocasiae TaxID=1848973 RepID=A0ABS7PVW8_9SPHN|nr:hypothetical protein [Sphingomonas colocasiae]
MDRMKIRIALACPLLLLACEQGRSPEKPVAPPVTETNAGHEMAVSGEGAPVAGPASTPPGLTPEAEAGVKGARNILLAFAQAIERKNYEQARALLAPADRQKWSRPAFAAIFADMGEITVAIPDGRIEGAAGSSYYTAPVTITGDDRDGRPVRIEGEAVLRRVNDVQGATPAQLRWHFEALTLDWAH